MSPIQNFEQHSRVLVEPDLPTQTRLQMAMEVRDSLEIAHTAEYLNFLKCYFRAFSSILTQLTKPQFVDNPEHKLRNIVVEILNRLPHSEVLRPFVQDLLKVAMHVLTSDNEENGLICIRIIFDLLRNFRQTLENEVQPFLDFVCKIYQDFRLTASHFFDNAAVATEDVKPMDTSSSSDHGIATTGYVGTGQLNPSTRSFKIVTESPLVVMFLFQLYSRLVQKNIPHLLPLMVAAISVPGPDKVPPHLKTQFIELKGAQVKTVSFLTYLLKSFADYIRPHEESICNSIVNLLVTCSDSVSIRKELLVALKHVLGTDFKRGLFPLIDTLLEERVLVGTGRACFETLRPLAYSLLAEIVHHVRSDLSLSQSHSQCIQIVEGKRREEKGMGEGKEGDWECSGCQNRNYAFRTFCNRCKQPRLLVDAKTPADSKWLPRIGDWICTGCTNNNYASRKECKKCGQPKEVAAMPAIAMPGASLPTYSHYFSRPPGALEQKVNYGLSSNCALQLPPAMLADNYVQAASTWSLGGNHFMGLSYANPASQPPSVPKGWRNGDWMCNCGYHNYSSRTRCKNCDASMPSAIGTKRLASEEFVHDWENKRLNSGNVHVEQQKYPGIDQILGTGHPRLLGVDAPLSNVGLGVAQGWQLPVQFPHQTITPPLLGKGAKQWRNGDWMCTNCNNHNYASRAQCNRCKTLRDGDTLSICQPVNTV